MKNDDERFLTISFITNKGAYDKIFMSGLEIYGINQIIESQNQLLLKKKKKFL